MSRLRQALVVGMRRGQVQVEATRSASTSPNVQSIGTMRTLEERLRENICVKSLGIPTHPLRVSPSLATSVHEGIDINVVSPEDTANRNIVNDYMLRNFFTTAPVPKATQLTSTLETNGQLKAEMDMLLNSGLAQLYRDQETGKIAGATLSMAWNMDDFDSFDVKATDWLNTGAKIAEEVGRTKEDVTAIWRAYLYQLIRHKFLCAAKKRNRDLAIYFGPIFTDPDFQRKKLALSFQQWSLKVADQHNALACFLLTMPFGFEAIKRHKLDLFTDIEDYAAYSDLSLCIDKNTRENVFGPLKDQTGIIFMVAKK